MKLASRIILLQALLYCSAASAAPAKSLTLGERAVFAQRTRALHADSRVQALLSHPGHALEPARLVGDSALSSARFQHFFQGLEVLGSAAIVHRTEEGADALSLPLSTFSLNPTPSFDAATAGALALSLSERDPAHFRVSSAPSLKILPREEGEARLVYQVSLERKDGGDGLDLVLDAKDGSLIARIPLHRDVAPVTVLDASKTPDSEIDAETGFPLRIDLPAASAHWKEIIVQSKAKVPGNQISATVKKAYANATRTLSYYEKVHGRRGFDGRGSPVVSVVHVGRKMNNAFWQSRDRYMAYGDGDGKVFRNFAEAVDVAGHELTHGIIGETADFLPFGESGALDEAFADIFGKLIESRNDDSGWILGANLFHDPRHAKRGIRNLAKPGLLEEEIVEKGAKRKVRHPAHLQEKIAARGPCDERNDRCWTHLNSTIGSHAFFRIFQRIGRGPAEKIYFRAMTQVLTENTTFARYALGIAQTCSLLFAERVCAMVREELAAVGLAPPTRTQGVRSPVVQGDGADMLALLGISAGGRD